MYDGKVYYKYKRDITEKIHAITQRNKELLSQNNPSTNDSNIRDGERKIIDYNMNHIQPIDTVKFQLKEIAKQKWKKMQERYDSQARTQNEQTLFSINGTSFHFCIN